jgi:putative ABC transport system permease protein
VAEGGQGGTDRPAPAPDERHQGLTWRLWARLIARETRGSRTRLAFFTLCLGIGVAAVVAVAALSSSLDRAIRGEARQLLAADLAVSGRRPAPPEILAAIDAVRGARRTETVEMVTIVAAPSLEPGQPGRSLLAELKVVGAGYPFYGTLELEPQQPLATLLDGQTTLVGADLLARLGLRVGDELRIGGQGFRIAGVVVREPDRIGDAFASGPRVLLAPEGLARTSLVGVGSRVYHRQLVRLPDDAPPEALTALGTRLSELLPKDDRLRIETYRDAQPNLRRGLDRVDRFLGLVALLSLLIGGVGVAQTVRAWLAGRLDAIAVMRCLGMRPREVLWLYVGQTAFFALVASLLGAAGGLALQRAIPMLLGDLVPARLITVWQPAAVAKGLLLGIGVSVLFSLPPLVAARRVPPIRVFRRSAEPLPANRWLRLGLGTILVGGLFVLASFQARSPALGGLFTLGVVAALALLAGAAALLVRVLARAPRRAAAEGRLRLSPALRHALATLTQPGGGTLPAAAALGLGLLVVTALALVERHLVRELSADLPTDAPTAFMVDIQPPQWPGVEQLLQGAGATRIDSVPVVMARIAEIDGVPVEQLKDGAEKGSDRRWALTREQRLTYGATLPADNQIIEGTLWSDPDRPEVTVEQEFARELGLELGSNVRFDIQGVPIELAVTSIRTVDWRTFGINFFLVVEPGVLEEAPQMRIAAARLPPGGEQRVQDALAADYANVTLLQIRDILDRLRRILERLAVGVRALGSFTVLAGVAILAGAVAANAARRGREVALLKTLGMTRRGVVTAFATEQALVGAVAGVIGVAGGGLLAWGVVTEGMELRWQLMPGLLSVLFVGGILLAMLGGLSASTRALARRPIEVLRQDSD